MKRRIYQYAMERKLPKPHIFKSGRWWRCFTNCWDEYRAESLAEAYDGWKSLTTR